MSKTVSWTRCVFLQATKRTFPHTGWVGLAGTALLTSSRWLAKLSCVQTSLISAGKSWGESPALLEELRADFSSSFGSSSTKGSVCSKGTLAFGFILENPLSFFRLSAVAVWDLVCIFVR